MRETRPDRSNEKGKKWRWFWEPSAVGILSEEKHWKAGVIALLQHPEMGGKKNVKTRSLKGGKRWRTRAITWVKVVF